MTNSINITSNEKYMINNTYDYSRWLSYFQTMLTRIERSSMSIDKKKTTNYYSSLIAMLKNCYIKNKACLIVTNDYDCIQPFTVEFGN